MKLSERTLLLGMLFLIPLVLAMPSFGLNNATPTSTADWNTSSGDNYDGQPPYPGNLLTWATMSTDPVACTNDEYKTKYTYSNYSINLNSSYNYVINNRCQGFADACPGTTGTSSCGGAVMSSYAFVAEIWNGTAWSTNFSSLNETALNDIFQVRYNYTSHVSGGAGPGSSYVTNNVKDEYISYSQMQLNVTRPTNGGIYYGTNMSFNFSANTTDTVTFNISASVDGSAIHTNNSYTNGTSLYFYNLTQPGRHTFLSNITIDGQILYNESNFTIIGLVTSCLNINISNADYIFNQSVLASAPVSCINITASNVTVNGNGSVVANGTSGVGIYVNGTNVTLENITLTNMSRYIQTTGQNVSIRNFTIVNSNGSVVFSPLSTQNFTPNAELNGSNFHLFGGLVRVSNSSFNVSANITLNQPQFTNVNRTLILRDQNDNGTFTVCPSTICDGRALSGSNFSFNVTGWTTYGGVEVDTNQTPQFDVQERTNRTFYMNISGINISSSNASINYNGTSTFANLTFSNTSLQMFRANVMVPAYNSSWGTNNVSWYWNFSITFLNGTFEGNSTLLENTNSTILSNILNISYRSEDNFSYLSGINLWINNATNVTYWSNQSNYSAFNFSQIATGLNVDLQAQYNGFTRHLFVNLTNSSQNVTIYFPATMNWFTFQVRSPDGAALPNAQIIMAKQLNATWTVIASAITDAGGQALIPLADGTYQYNVSLTGYNPLANTTTLIFAINPVNTIFLFPTTTGITPPPANTWAGNASLNWSPAIRIINWRSGVTHNVTFTFLDTQTLTNLLTLNVTVKNFSSNTIQSVNNMSSTSNSFSYVNLLNWTGATYTFYVCINRTTPGNASDTQLFCVTQQYIYQNSTGIGSWNAVESEARGGLSVMTWKILAFLALAVVTSALMFVSGPASLMVFMAGVAIIGYFGILNVFEALILELIAIIVLWGMSR